MNVISILTEEKDSAYEIFEILNAKEKNLANILCPGGTATAIS